MSVSLSTVASMVNMLLNAATSYSATVTDPRLYTAGVADVILSVDGVVVQLIEGNPNHGRRKDFLTTLGSNITSGSQLPTHVGPIEAIQFAITGGKFNGVTLDADELEVEQYGQIVQENLNPNANTNIRPHYVLKGQTLYHNAAGMVLGGAASIIVNATGCTYTRTGACQASDEYHDTEVIGALSRLFPVEGENVTAAQHFQGEFQQAESIIGSGLATVPSYRIIAQLKASQQAQEGQ